MTEESLYVKASINMSINLLLHSYLSQEIEAHGRTVERSAAVWTLSFLV